MAFLKSKLLRRTILTVILIWASVAFWLLNEVATVSIITIVLALPVLYLIWSEKHPLIVLVFLSFISAFALYGFLFYFNLPLWIIMIASLLLYGYFFTYLEQKIGILGKERLIYLLLFSLAILEMFLILSYFLISPLNRSLIIALSSYLLAGFCFSVIEEKKPKAFPPYIWTFSVMIVLLLLSANWGS